MVVSLWVIFKQSIILTLVNFCSWYLLKEWASDFYLFAPLMWSSLLPINQIPFSDKLKLILKFFKNNFDSYNQSSWSKLGYHLTQELNGLLRTCLSSALFSWYLLARSPSPSDSKGNMGQLQASWEPTAWPCSVVLWKSQGTCHPRTLGGVGAVPVSFLSLGLILLLFLHVAISFIPALDFCT